MIQRIFMAVSCFAFALLISPSARADVTSSAAGAFLITATADVATPPDRTWRALTQIGRWWSPDHSYSGDPVRRMTLDPRGGGCFCERWGGNSVEHGRVLAVMDNEGVRTLRVQGALGPLQDMGVSGILTFTVSPNASGTRIVMTYRVAGDPGLGLDRIATPVDHVLMEQFGRLTRYADTGAPN
jgi:uncharacterized protein YndB with AHSA1/START domain